MSSFSKKLNKHKQIWSSLFTNHKSIYRLLSLINRPNIWKIISISEKNGFKKSAGIINLLEKIHLRLDRWEEFLHRNLALGTICRCTFTQTCTKPLTFKHIISYEHAEPILAENNSGSLWIIHSFYSSFYRAMLCIARTMPLQDALRLSVCLSHAGVLSKRS